MEGVVAFQARKNETVVRLSPSLRTCMAPVLSRCCSVHGMYTAVIMYWGRIKYGVSGSETDSSSRRIMEETSYLYQSSTSVLALV